MAAAALTQKHCAAAKKHCGEVRGWSMDRGVEVIRRVASACLFACRMSTCMCMSFFTWFLCKASHAIHCYPLLTIAQTLSWIWLVLTLPQVLELDPANVKALYRRAQALMHTGDLLESQRDVKMALDVDPDNADLQVRRGWVHSTSTCMV